MGRRPCCEKVGVNRGGWTPIEDKILVAYIKANGEGKWRDLPKRAGLKRCGKSCRLRWLNYLNPNIIRGNITAEEEELIIKLQEQLGNRWSLIAGKLPGRTDNEIKNYWNTILHKKVQGDHPCSAPPKRKPRKKSNGKNSERPVKPPAIPPPALVLPSMIKPCTEDPLLTMQQPAQCQDHNQSEASRSKHDLMTDFGPGDMNITDIDKCLAFLFDEEINAPIWEDDMCANKDVSLEPALSLDDYMFDYWTENTYIEQNNKFDLGSLAAFFETEQALGIM